MRANASSGAVQDGAPPAPRPARAGTRPSARFFRRTALWTALLLAGGLAWGLNGRLSSSAKMFPQVLPAAAARIISAAAAVRTPPAAAPDSPCLTPKTLILLLLAVIYLLARQPWTDYPAFFVLGAGASVYIGTRMGFYDAAMAWSSLAAGRNAICLLVVLNLIAAALASGGFYEHLGRRAATAARSDPWRIMLWFCLLTYAVSLWANNLTAILVLIPMLLSLCRQLGLDPQPYLIGMIVASNLGGASTMVGDFPNILIAGKAGIGFWRFLTRMMPICLILLLVLLAYLRLTLSRRWTPPSLSPSGSNSRRYACPLPDRSRSLAATQFPAAGSSRSPAAGGPCALTVTGLSPDRILGGLDMRSILFFAGVLVLAGAAKASGLLDSAGDLITRLACGSGLARCLLLMWTAAAAAALLNAGPCAALFLPMALGSGPAAPQDLCCWSLALGVLAGATATVTGATAGSAAAVMLSEHQNGLAKAAAACGRTPPPRTPLTFASHVQVAMPLALIFLALASAYITLLYRFG